MLQVPYRHPFAQKLGVVQCFSPQFVTERWQLMIMVLEIYRQYGVSLQVFYLESMLASILELLKVYALTTALTYCP